MTQHAKKMLWRYFCDKDIIRSLQHKTNNKKVQQSKTSKQISSMSADTPNDKGRNGAEDDEGQKGESIMGSIAALRRILMIDTPTKSLLNQDNATTIVMNQRQYEERQKLERQMEELKKSLSTAQDKLKDANEGIENERALRKKLEVAYEALSQHRKELTSQLETLTDSRKVLDEELETTKQSLGDGQKQIETLKEEQAKELEKFNKKLDELTNEAADWRARFNSVSKVAVADGDKLKEAENEIKKLKEQIEQSSQSDSKNKQEAEKQLQEVKKLQVRKAYYELSLHHQPFKQTIVNFFF